MCVIVVKPKEKKLDKKYWAECFRMNGHGAGLVYVEDKKLVVDKGYFDFEDLYVQIAKHEDKDLVVHFRISSAGAINEDNCHPFFMQSVTHPKFAWAFVHNGTLQYPSTKEESDTNRFTSRVLGPLLDRDPWFLEYHSGQEMIRGYCGERNKMVIVRYDMEADECKQFFVNKLAGTEDMGCWFSNNSYKVYTHHNIYNSRFGEDADFFDYRGFADDKDWKEWGYYQNAQGRWVPNRLKHMEAKQIKQLAPATQIVQNGQGLSGSLGTNIVVPRDKEVDIEIARLLRLNSRLEHLSKKGKKIMRRLAIDYAKKLLNPEEYAELTLADFIQNFREDLSLTVMDFEIRKLDEKRFDQWVVNEFITTGKHPMADVQVLGGSDDPEDLTPDEADIKEGVIATISKFPDQPLMINQINN